MVNRLRLPLVIAVVVIVAMLLPGASMIAAPENPRVTGISSYISGSSGMKMTYGAKGDAKNGLVTFVGRLYNTSADTVLNVRYRARIPDGTSLVESWCVTPGTYPVDSVAPDGWIEWSRVRQTRTADGSAPLCGFTVSGWDGKSQLVSGWQASWDSKTGVQNWIDEFGAAHYDVAATVKFPFDFGGFQNAQGVDAAFLAPTKATFDALAARVKALEAKAGMSAGEE